MTKPNEKNKASGIHFALVLSLTLGLAPFVPEPHILGKIRWVWGGAVGMQPMDFFDLMLHGAPWVYLVVMVVKYLVALKNRAAQHLTEVKRH